MWSKEESKPYSFGGWENAVFIFIDWLINCWTIPLNSFIYYIIYYYIVYYLINYFTDLKKKKKTVEHTVVYSKSIFWLSISSTYQTKHFDGIICQSVTI